MKLSKVVLVVVIIIIAVLFFYLDLQHFLNLDYLKQQQAEIESYRSQQPVVAVLIYLAIYIAVTALSLPGATILTLAGGGVFGLFWGTFIVSFASTIGASLAFLAARFLFRDAVQSRFARRMKAINDGIEKDGAFYLFSLRLIPIFPFFMINLTMGLTSLKLWTFYWVSQLGMFAGTIVYVNAGTQLFRIESLSGIFSPALIFSFALLGLFPLLAKQLIARFNAYKVYNKWKKPKQFDNNLLVIGAGSGGLVTAYIAAAVKAKVTLIEKHKMGGDCLNTGCVPSKALIRSARYIESNRRSERYGVKRSQLDFDFSEVMSRVHDVIRQVEPHDSIERYTDLGVNVLTGTARIISPWEVEVETDAGKQVLSARSIVIAAGARPFVPEIPGIDQVISYTSDTIWGLTLLPPRLLVMGGGPIGCELSQCFARLGSQVVQIERSGRILSREDLDVSEFMMQRFKEEGIDIRCQHKPVEFKASDTGSVLVAQYQDSLVEVEFDVLLLATGRQANVTGYGLEKLDIALSNKQTLETNPFQQTNYPNIFACGDVCGPFQFTHTAAHQAWYAAVNALFGDVKKFATDYSVIPWSTFTDPEVARVGLNEQEAKEQSVDYEVVKYGIDNLDRAIADSEAHGFVKVLTEPGKDRILGVTIVADHGGDLLAEFVLAMKHNIGLNKILSTIHIYPTMSEANKYAAGLWKKQHAPEAVLRWVAKYHAWRRS